MLATQIKHGLLLGLAAPRDIAHLKYPIYDKLQNMFMRIRLHLSAVVFHVMA